MAFPTTPAPTVDSEFIPFENHARDRSRGGAGDVQDNYDGAMRGFFRLVYIGITTTQRDSFWTDYDATADTFSFTWPKDSNSYTVCYFGQPRESMRAAANLWDMEIKLAIVPALADTIDDQAGDAIFDQAGADMDNQA